MHRNKDSLIKIIILFYFIILYKVNKITHSIYLLMF